jgi:hypothetical protein
MTPGRAALRLGLDARLLPGDVRWFYLKALGTAVRRDDRWSLTHAHSSTELASLIGIAGDARVVVQLGAQTGWAALALALNGERQVTAFGGPPVAPEPGPYASLVDPSVRARIDFREDAVEGAALIVPEPADLVLVDTPGSYEQTLAAIVGGEQVVRPGGAVVVRGHLRPEVRAAIKKLALEGSVADDTFLWHKPFEEPPSAAEVLAPRMRLLGFALVGSLVGAAAGVTVPVQDSITNLLQGNGGESLRELPAPVASSAVHRHHASSARRSHSPAHARAHRSARAQPNAPPPPLRTFSGARDRRIGTIRVDDPTVLKWRAATSPLVIESDGWRLRARERTGTTVLSPGTYQGFGIETSGGWTLRLKRKHRPDLILNSHTH